MASKIVDKRYPESGTYRGRAVKCRMYGETLPFVDISDKIVEYVESEVANDGATMLSLEVWEWHQNIPHAPYYVRTWLVVVRAYGGSVEYAGLIAPPTWPVIGGILVLLIALGVVLYFGLKMISEILYGPGGEGYGIIPVTIGIIGFTFVSYLAYKTLQERKAITA